MDGYIDPHVHCRDWEQSYKATIKSVTELARSQSVIAMFDMPNTVPPMTTEELVKRRIQTAKDEGCIDGYYLYMALTGDPKQTKEAAEVAQSNDRVVGLKLFGARSIGAVHVDDEKMQRSVYDTLAEAGYTGVVAIHAEKEAHISLGLWNPEFPYTWNMARPPESEIESVKDQIKFAKETGFLGTIHICHITTPEAVRTVSAAKSSVNITCGVTPHHLTLSTSDMQDMSGLAYKVNPPLRDIQTVEEMRKLLFKGEMDWIETDHAPHTTEEKAFRPGRELLSGIPSMNTFASFIEDLESEGMKERQIRDLTYSNIKKVFTKVVE